MGASIPTAIVPMIGASGAISAVIGAFALSFGRAKQITSARRRSTAGSTSLWLLVAWVVLQLMMGWLAGGQGYLLATPAHVGGFAARACCCSGRCCCGATARPSLRLYRPRDARIVALGSGSSSRCRWTTTYFISASSTVRWALPRQASSAAA